MSSSTNHNSKKVEPKVELTMDKINNADTKVWDEPTMDKINSAGAKVWDTQGVESAVEYMCTNSDGTPRSYADMRLLFG